MTKAVTLKEFKEWLAQFPDDTIVEVAIQSASSMFESYGSVEFEAPVIESEYEGCTSGRGWEFTDFTDNQFVKEGDACFRKRFLYLGEKY